MKSVVGDGYCFICGNNGFIDKVCPSCGREPTLRSMNFEYKQDTQDFVSKIDSFGIPEVYRGVIWDAEILKNSKQSLLNDYNFIRFVDQLQKINKVFASGVLTQKSAIIIAPAGFSKMTFAYSCMQRALDNDFTVAPLLDTNELKRLIFISSENTKYKLYDKISYDQYLTSDVMFITVTKLKQHEWAYEVIQEILDKRTRLGLGTFIISRFDLSEISRRDYSNSFEALADTVSNDAYKYPAVISYKRFTK